MPLDWRWRYHDTHALGSSSASHRRKGIDFSLERHQWAQRMQAPVLRNAGFSGKHLHQAFCLSYLNNMKYKFNSVYQTYSLGLGRLRTFSIPNERLASLFELHPYRTNLPITTAAANQSHPVFFSPLTSCSASPQLQSSPQLQPSPPSAHNSPHIDSTKP